MSGNARPRPAARARTLACPNCGGSIEVRASGISITAICASCGATVDVAIPELKLIAEASERTKEPLIPIGRRGALFGTEWDVIGYQTRSDPAEGSWDEYLLFNPYRGFRFLARDSEGWSLFCMLRHDVQPSGPPESESEAVTDYVLGEFYWRVRVGDRAAVRTFTAGSQILLQERTGDEVVWSQGAALQEKVVQTAFKITAPLSPAAHTAHRAPTVRVLQIAVVAFVLLCLLDIIPFGRSRSLPVFQQAFTTSPADRGRTIVTAPFAVPDASGNLQIQINSPVQDDWLEVGLALVRQDSDLTFTARPTIEYYSGYDSDGSWEEGSQSARVLFANVPGGTYRLLVDTDAGAYAKQPAGMAMKPPLIPQPEPESDPTRVSFDLTVRRHVPAQEFFWIALLCLAPYPLYRLFFRRGSA